MDKNDFLDYNENMKSEEAKRFDREVGIRIQKIRMEKNLSCKELADAVGLTTVFLSNVENGKSGIAIFNLVKIADALHVSTQQLLHGGADEMDSYVYERYMKILSLDESDRETVIEVMNKLIEQLKKTN